MRKQNGAPHEPQSAAGILPAEEPEKCLPTRRRQHLVGGSWSQCMQRFILPKRAKPKAGRRAASEFDRSGFMQAEKLLRSACGIGGEAVGAARTHYPIGDRRPGRTRQIN